MARMKSYYLGDPVLYFAYGSNMNPERMKYRVPAARAFGVGVLKGWEVKERLYADIQRKAGACVDGVLYLMQWYDVEKLDHFEGAPNTYKRQFVKVMVGGMKVDALVYVMTKNTVEQREGSSYPDDYREICSRGARMFGIPDVFGK